MLISQFCDSGNRIKSSIFGKGVGDDFESLGIFPEKTLIFLHTNKMRLNVYI